MRLMPALVLSAAVAACATKEPPQVAECVTPPPPTGLDPVRDAEGALGYARQLSFFPGAAPYGERRALTVVTQPGTPLERRFGLAAVVEVQPEQCSHRNDTTALAGTSGRIVARLIASDAYDKLGLPRDTSYLWIDSLVLRGAQGTARGVIIPGTAGLPAAIRRIRVEYHPETGVRSWPEARLQFDADDDEVWESCVVFGCCYLEGGVPGGGG